MHISRNCIAQMCGTLDCFANACPMDFDHYLAEVSLVLAGENLTNYMGSDPGSVANSMFPGNSRP